MTRLFVPRGYREEERRRAIKRAAPGNAIEELRKVGWTPGVLRAVADLIERGEVDPDEFEAAAYASNPVQTAIQGLKWLATAIESYWE